MNSRFNTNAPDPSFNSELGDSKKQWDEIDDQVRDMLCWNDDFTSSLSSSPANRNAVAVVTRPHTSQYNPLYRRSEGDILGASLSPPGSANPPQSAPILQEEFEPQWGNQHTGILSDTAGHKVMRSGKHEHILGEANPSSNLLCSIPEIKHDGNQLSQGTDNFVYRRTDNTSVLPTIRPSAAMRHSLSSNAIPDHSFKPGIPPHTPMFPLHHQTSSPLLQTHKSSPSARRKSAPITSSILRTTGNPRATQRTMSQHPNAIPNIYPPFPEEDFGFSVVRSPEDEKQPADVNNDKEYTRALLQHQRDRMIRLEKEIEAKKNELKLLYDDIRVMEFKVTQRNSSNTTLSKLQFDVGRLREINRKLKIDCNCMFKEVELFSRDSDSTSDDFYSRYNRPQSFKTKSKKDGHMKPMYSRSDLPPPPAPPPADPNDDATWSCSHCTFDNHAALNKCEICNFSRVIVPGRT